MTDILKQFGTQFAIPLAIWAAWYLLSGALALVFSRRTQIDAWCAANPKLAFALNLLRATGIDVWKIAAATKTYAESRAEVPPRLATKEKVEYVGDMKIKTSTVTRTTPIGCLFVALLVSGCSLEAARTARINSQLKAAQSGQQAPTRPEAECKTIDNVTVYTMYGAEISLGAGVGAGALAAATEGKTRDYATAVGIGTAAVAGTLAYWSSKSAAQWAERCQ